MGILNDVLNIEGLNDLNKLKHDFIKAHAVRVLKQVLELIEEEKYEEVFSMITTFEETCESCKSTCILFNNDGASYEVMDIGDIIRLLVKYKNDVFV